MRITNIKRVCRISLLFAAIAAPNLFVAHATAAAPAAQETAMVSIDNFSFTPMDITIPAGGQVTWTNKDDVPHTVVSVDHQFKSKTLDTDEKFSFTFQNPGTYEYFCSVHPKMTGKIVVK